MGVLLLPLVVQYLFRPKAVTSPCVCDSLLQQHLTALLLQLVTAG